MDPEIIVHEEALEDLFGAGARVTVAKKPAAGVTEPTAPGAPTPTGVDVDTLAQLIGRAQTLSAEADRLRRTGDLAGYQAKNEELQKVIKQLGAAVQ